ncbi:MAG: 30S ribosomal protein S1 [Chloroflexota bacterium]
MTEPQQGDAGTQPATTAITADEPRTTTEDAPQATEAADTAAEAIAEAPAAPQETAVAEAPPEPDGEAGPAEAAAAEAPPEPDVDAAAAVAEAPPEPDAETVPAEAAPGGDHGLSAEDLESAPAAEPEPEPVAVDTRPEPTTMEELLNEQSGDIRSLKHGDVVEGTVVRIDKDEMLVDIGAKSEGVVSNRELYGRNTEAQPQLAIGDTVLVYVLQPESNEGHAVLSLRRAGLERKWRAMQEQLDAGAIIEAPVIDHNKGGLIVDCGIRGFVPISQIVDFPRRPQNEQPRDAAQEIAEKLQPYVGRKLRLKILEVNRKANRLILSEKVALYEERREKRDELFSSLQVGQHVKGNVRSIAPFGVFVDLGGIDGLVHKSELSWNKVNNPESGYQVGEEVEAEVIDINHERGRISLSIRRLQPDPWNSTVADLKVGDIIEGTVTKIVNFGAFVRVREGLEGLIHISELSHQRVAHPGDVVHEGQRLKLKVISLDSERHRLGLSLKQAEEAPARPEPRERRPRPERGYDPSQAVQEPEGGIDNTLAAAFAQVRAQVAAQERDRETASVVEEVAEAAVAQDVADLEAGEEVAEAAVAADVADLEDAEAAVEADLADRAVALAEAEADAEAELAAAAPTMSADDLNDAQADLAEAEMTAEDDLEAEIVAVAEAEDAAEEAVAEEVVAVAEAEDAAESAVADEIVSVAEAEAELDEAVASETEDSQG